MGKNLSFKIAKNTFSASITKVDRAKVYGYVEELVLDSSGNPCTTASLLDDGQTLILAGATAMKTVDDAMNEVDKKILKTVYLDGKDAIMVPSSYDGEIELNKTSLDSLFNLEVATVYQLSWEDEASKKEMLIALENTAVYEFVFNYRADYEGADAVVISAQNEVFVLTGRMLAFDYLENKTAAPIVEEVTAEAVEEEMDFGML